MYHITFARVVSSHVLADGLCFAPDEVLTEALRVNLQRLIAYACSADTALQREIAEKLANEAVKRT